MSRLVTNKRIDSFIKIPVQLFISKSARWLVEGIAKRHSTDIVKVAVNDVQRGVEAQQGIVEGHREVTGRLVLCRGDLEFGGQDLIDLGVQDREGAGFGALQCSLKRK